MAAADAALDAVGWAPGSVQPRLVMSMWALEPVGWGVGFLNLPVVAVLDAGPTNRMETGHGSPGQRAVQLMAVGPMPSVRLPVETLSGCSLHCCGVAHGWVLHLLQEAPRKHWQSP